MILYLHEPTPPDKHESYEVVLESKHFHVVEEMSSFLTWCIVVPLLLEDAHLCNFLLVTWLTVTHTSCHMWY